MILFVYLVNIIFFSLFYKSRMPRKLAIVFFAVGQIQENWIQSIDIWHLKKKSSEHAESRYFWRDNVIYKIGVGIYRIENTIVKKKIKLFEIFLLYYDSIWSIANEKSNRYTFQTVLDQDPTRRKSCNQPERKTIIFSILC